MAKKATAIAVVMSSVGSDPYGEAMDKAADPAMLTKDNPLSRPISVDAPNPAIVDYNMERLHQDARSRRCPFNGSVYRGIMSTRFGG